MITRSIFIWLSAVGLALSSAPAVAQQGSAELQERSEQVLTLLRGQADPAELFTPEFLAQVPPAQLEAVTRQLTGQYGPAQSVRLEPRGTNEGVLHIETERGALTMNLAIQPQPPHRISGLVVTRAEMRGDSLPAVLDEIRALPGRTAVTVARLEESGIRSLAAHQPDQAMAIGSTFKLFVLAELSRQVQAGERSWSDVVMLSGRSLPSGMLHNWPEGAPVTLHTLASLMISISDNTATDILLGLVGRENVERMMGRIGIAAPERNRPFLATREIFALKTAPEAEQRAFIEADEAGRRRLLGTRYASVDATAIDASRFGGAPLAIDTLEWFASPADLVRTLDWLRRHGDAVALEILAISPGGPASLRQDFAYIGYKGGSEPGVINLSWLVRTPAGAWHVVTGSWNDPAAPVDEGRFTTLMRRALQLAR